MEKKECKHRTHTVDAEGVNGAHRHSSVAVRACDLFVVRARVRERIRSNTNIALHILQHRGSHSTPFDILNAYQ